MGSADINQSKYMNAVLYFIQNCNNNYLGQTKLNKLMYYLDFVSYRDRKKAISGDKYVHLDYGPVPDHIQDVIVDLKKEGKVDIVFKAYKEGHKAKFELKEEPDLSVFDEYEKALLDEICNTFELWPTDKIVSQTHLEAPWFYSKPYDEVDYGHAGDIDLVQVTTPVHASS